MAIRVKLGDGSHGPWHPHLMFFVLPTATSDEGTDLFGAQVFGSGAGVYLRTMYKYLLQIDPTAALTRAPRAGTSCDVDPSRDNKRCAVVEKRPIVVERLMAT